SFDHRERPESGDPFGDAGALAHRDDVGDVLVGLGCLLGEQAGLRHADRYALRAHALGDVDPAQLALRRAATLETTGAVTRGAEGLAHAAFGADEKIGVASHVPWDEHGLADRAVAHRHVGVPRRERARRTLAVHHEPSRTALHLVHLGLGDVVRHVVHEAHAE